ncbi:MAG: TonB-dependent receptor [Myxococcales bacterium]|nr:TonB-dependent receptor [Myxococcales bacterium]
MHALAYSARALRIAALCYLACEASSAAASESATFETVVRGEQRSAAPLSFSLSSDDAHHVPGGFGDALRAVEALPGVLRPALGSGQLVVWGSAPAESRIFIEGIELPALYHLGGLRTVIPTAAVKDLTLIPAGYGADYGRGLGGLLLIKERELSIGLHGEVSADLLDVGAQLSASLGNRLRVAVSGRYSYLDKVLSALGGPAFGDFFPLPTYADFQARARLTLRTEESLSFLALGSWDSLRRTHAVADAATLQSETWQRSFYRIGLRYERQQSAHIAITPWLGIDRASYDAQFADVPATSDRRELRYGLRASYATRLRTWLAASAAVDLVSVHSDLMRQGTLTRPPREGDRAVFGQHPGREVAADSYSSHMLDLAPSLSLVFRIGALRIEPGLRLSMLLIDVDRLLPRIGASPPIGARQLQLLAEPRLQVRYQPRPPWTLFAATGLYHQPPDPQDLSAVFGNPTLHASRAVSVAVGTELLMLSVIQAKLTGYYRQLDQLVMRSTLLTPPLARALTQDGTGQSYGAQLVIALLPWRSLSATLSYAMGRMLRRDAPSLPLRLADFDQTHTLQASARYVLWGIGLSVRFRYTTGMPRSEVIGSYFDTSSDVYQPIFGLANAIRLPAFVQLDVQLDRAFSLGKGVSLSLYLEVQNVTNYQNAEELAYRYDFTQREYITSIPTLAVLGTRLSF